MRICPAPRTSTELQRDLPSNAVDRRSPGCSKEEATDRGAAWGAALVELQPEAESGWIDKGVRRRPFWRSVMHSNVPISLGRGAFG